MPPWGPDLENKSILFYSVSVVVYAIYYYIGA